MQEHVFVGYSSTFGVVCLDCCAETRQFYMTKDEAIAAWNRRAQPEVVPTFRAEPNKPLTLEELRGMHREPVWITGKGTSGWVVVLWDYVNRIAHSNHLGNVFFLSEYGKTWLAYRHKPEGDNPNEM